jgi:hypothetical protein
VHRVNVSSRHLACKALPGAVGCGPQQLISSFDWNGGSVQTTCAGLPDPPFDGTVNVGVSTSSTVTNTSTNTQTVTNTGTHVIPGDPPPPPPPTIWTWQGTRYVTTCTAFGCDAVEWASCSGPNCPRSSVDCYCVYPSGCHASGSTQQAMPSGLCFY